MAFAPPPPTSFSLLSFPRPHRLPLRIDAHTIGRTLVGLIDQLCVNYTNITRDKNHVSTLTSMHLDLFSAVQLTEMFLFCM